jgi:hypothetical protein
VASRYDDLKPFADRLGITVAELEQLKYVTPFETGYVADELTAMPRRDERSGACGLFQMLPADRLRRYR